MNVGRRKWLGAAAGTLAGGLVQGERARAAERGLTFEIYADAKKEYRWRLKASNGNVVATSGQGYKAKADCRHGVELIQQGAADAKVVDSTASATAK